uniref:Uncharacterized protein n=1 Tax=Zonotrichia albicollis TaxID=44394 RepID=A0A8D2M3Q9_ZONAL
MESMVVSDGNQHFPEIQQFSKKEIEDLLRKGAYAAIMDEDDEGAKFCEEDIEQILLRRSTTITIESEGKGSTFAKVGHGGAAEGPHRVGWGWRRSRWVYMDFSGPEEDPNGCK